jgi:hypothetical protein
MGHAMRARTEEEEEVMPAKKVFYCPRCRHTEEERVPHRLRCPKCGASIPRPERREIVRPGPGSDPRQSRQQFFY